MTYIFRFIIVLAVAVAIGVGLYYLVQVLPNNPNFASEGERIRPEDNDGPVTPRDGNRPEGFERGERGPTLFAFVGVFGRLALFSVITFIAVVIKNRFRKKPGKKVNSSQ